MKKLSHVSYLLIIIAASIPWLTILFVPFVNDDFQILGFHSVKSFTDIFSPFFQSDISGYYYRPLGNFLHSLTIYLFGFDSFYHRLVNMILYILLTVSVALTGKEIGLSEKGAVIAGLLFAVLPSHDLLLAWNALKGESLLIILLLWSFIFYKKYVELDRIIYFYLSLLLSLLAMLTKELAFASVLFPFFIFFFFNENKNVTLKKSLINSISFLLLIVLVFILRTAVESGNPFMSGHFNNSPLTMILNFVLYIPASFLTPDLMERIYYSFTDFSSLISFIVIILFFVLIFFAVFIKNKVTENKLILFTLAWFIIFILPVIPTFMRWYVFTASIGLIWLLAFTLDKFLLIYPKKIFLAPLLIIFHLAMLADFKITHSWKDAGTKMDRLNENIYENKNLITNDTIYVWALPDKINGAPIMKLGVTQTFWFFTGNKNLDVNAPLRCEINSTESYIEYKVVDENEFQLKIIGGRFLLHGGRSRSHFIDEKIEHSDNGFNISIENIVDANGLPIGNATIKISSELINYFNLYYNGEDFLPVKFENNNHNMD